MAWYDDLNQQVAGGQYNAFAKPQTQPIKAPKASKKKDFATDQISTVGGIGGALGGAATGAAIGSVIPGIGTVIGGLVGGIAGGALGSGGGELAENAIVGEQDLLKNVGQEALLGGVFSAPPIRLAKGLAAAGKAAGSGTAKTAFEQAFTAPAKNTLKNLGNNVSGKMYAQAFTVPRRIASNLKPEETSRQLIKYGISGSLDQVDNTARTVLSTLGRAVDGSVGDIGGQIKVGDVTGVANNALKGIKVSKGDKDALMARLTDLGTTGSLPGYATPSQLLDAVRDLESRGFARINAAESALVRNPDMADLGNAYVQAAKEIEDNLYRAVGKGGTLKALQTPETAAQLNSIAKGLGDEFVAAKDLGEVRSLMAPFVRAKNLISTTRDEMQTAGQGIGGRLGSGGAGALAGLGLGGPVGAAAGAGLGFLGAPLVRGAQEAAQAPISTTVGKAIGNAANRIPTAGAPSSVVGGLGSLTARQGIGQNVLGNQGSAQPSLDEVLMQQGNVSQGGEQGFGQQQPQQQVQQSPYGRENLLYDIQRDPQNADQYIQYYQQLQEVFAPASSNISSTTGTQLASSSNAINTLEQLQGLYQQAGGGGGKIGGTVSNLLAGAGLNGNTQTYNDLSASSVSQLARALNGGGQVSDADAAVVIQALPKITDSPEVAQMKFNALRQRLAAAQQNTLTYGGGGSLEDVLLSRGSYQ